MRFFGMPARATVPALLLSAALTASGDLPLRAQPALSMAPVRSADDPPASEAPGGNVVSMSPIYSSGDPERSAPDGLSDAPARGPAGPIALSPVDHALFIQALDSAARHDWRTARAFAERGSDPTAKRLVEWRYLLDDRSDASFDQMAAFLGQHANWPRADAILARAEQAMPGGLDPHQVIGWFGAHAPKTGQGAVRYGEALIAVGKREEGIAAIRDAWIRFSFTPAEETLILRDHGDVLTQADQRARLLQFLSKNDLAAAKRQMARVDSQTERVADARLKLKANPSLAGRLLSGLDPSLHNDPGLVLDRARALRRSGSDEEAWATLMAAPTTQDAFVGPAQWWTERHIMARDALKAGKPQLAYQLVSAHGVDSGAALAEAEFLSGWIALRYLGKPADALEHFTELSRAVGLPISRARAFYWMGRSLEALNRPAEAAASYRKAAADSSTYYGQLALTRLHPAPVLHLATAAPDLKAARPAFEGDDRVRAVRVLGDLGERYLVRIFALHLAREINTPAEFTLLAELMAGIDEPSVTLRIAKLASYKDTLLLNYLDPVISLPKAPKGVSVEPALVLGLTRQESEFDSGAVSSVGARGLMQVMPASARQAAKAHGIRFQANKLGEPAYNMQIGMAHLSDFLNQWNGSYILALASYNAGPNAVKTWVANYGDPRSKAIDPIDWIELIPYGETRNYVQRVLENVEVYRNRLAGSDQKLMILADLYRPNAPPPVDIVKVPAPTTGASLSQPAPARPDIAGGSAETAAR